MVKENAQVKVYEKLAFQDILTSAKNRACFERDFERFKTNVEARGHLVLGMFDVNGLKQINDTLGHKEGDTLIRNATQALTAAFGDRADIYRMGGDEFALLSTQLSGRELEPYMEKLSQTIEKMNETAAFPLSIAGALCLFDPQLDANPDELLKRVDHEMYRHKAEMKSSAPEG